MSTNGVGRTGGRCRSRRLQRRLRSADQEGMGDVPFLVLDGGRVRVALHPGRRLVARVIRVDGTSALVSLAGAELQVALAAGVKASPNDTLTLEVDAVADGSVRLRAR